MLLCKRFSTALFLMLCVAAMPDRAAAQATLTVVTGSGAPGGTVTVVVSLNTNGTQPAAVQFDLTYPTADLSPAAGTFYATGSAAGAAGKSTTCGIPSTGDVRCVIAGFNTTAMTTGNVASITFRIANTTDTSAALRLSGVSGADASGHSLTLTGAGGSVTITQPVVTLAGLTCTPATVVAPVSSSCTVTMSGPTKSNTSVSLKSNSANATVPSSVMVSSQSSTAKFAVTTKAVSTQTGAVITATLGSVAKPFTVMLTPAVVSVTALVCTPNPLTTPGTASCTATVSKIAPTGGLKLTTSVAGGKTILTVPASVTVAVGATTATFKASATAVGGNNTAVVVASLNATSQQATLQLLPPPSIAKAVCSPNRIYSRGVSVCTVTLRNAAPAGGAKILVGLASSAPLTLPASVTVASGSIATQFSIQAGVISVNQTAAVTFNLSGKTAQFGVNLAAGNP